jgi:hypothetical protein
MQTNSTRYLTRFTAQLRTVGILVPPREIERLVRLITYVTIEHGVHMVFRTNTVFQDGEKPFELRDIFAIQEFLFATEEMTLFVITLMSSVFFHPQEHIVIETLAKQTLNYHGAGVVPELSSIARGSPTDDNPDGDIDYNYVELSGLYQGMRSPLQQAASRIATRMHNADIRVSENIIHDILLRCEENSLTCKPYKGLAARGQVDETLPLVLVKPNSVWFLRGFLDTVLATKPGGAFTMQMHTDASR